MARPAGALVVPIVLCLALLVSVCDGVGSTRQYSSGVQKNSTKLPEEPAVKPAKMGVNLGLDGEATKIGREGKLYTSEKSKNETEKEMKLDLRPAEIAKMLKAFWRGTLSNNTAEATTPDDGYASTMSGAINLNPFLDGTALSNALALSGKNGSADSKGMVFGLVGNGRVSSDALALGRSAAESNVQGLSFNAIGAQSTVSSNTAFTAGAAKTGVKAGALTIAGPVVSAGLSNALGVKAASSDGKAASMTAVGPSSSSVFSNSLTTGTAKSSSGVLSSAVSGPTYSTTGSLATSLGSDASSASRSKSLSGKGPSVSKSGAVSLARESSAASTMSNATAIEGSSRSIASSLAYGVMASSDSGAVSAATLGDAKAATAAKAYGTTGAAVATNATAHSKMGGYYSSTSSTMRAGTAKIGLFGFKKLPLMPPVPILWPSLGRARMRGAIAKADAPSATSIMTGSLAQSAALKALLPDVPHITPGFASDQPIEFEQAVAAGNETAAPPLCNSTIGITVNCTEPSPLNETAAAQTKATNDTLAALGGIFGGLLEKNKKFIERNTPPAPPRPPAPPPPPPMKKSATVVIPKKSSASPLTALSFSSPSPPGGGKKGPIPLPVKKPVASSSSRAPSSPPPTKAKVRRLQQGYDLNR